MEPWREDALKRGYQGIAAFPFALGTKNVGVLALYAPFTGFFGDQIVTLLDELLVTLRLHSGQSTIIMNGLPLNVRYREARLSSGASLIR